MRRTLNSLISQTGVEGLEWELLIVDNNSTDDTRIVSDEHAVDLPIRYFFEPVQGLSAARNKALEEFRGDHLVFTDDDVILDPAWLYAWNSAISDFPDAAYFGGRILPLWNENKPRWLVDSSMSLISGLLGQFDLGEEVRLFDNEDPLPFGANFAVRRELTAELSKFREDLGVRGSDVGRGEEAEYIERARSADKFGVYVGSAICLHAAELAEIHKQLPLQIWRRKRAR